MSYSLDCNTPGVQCPKGSACDHKSGQCLEFAPPHSTPMSLDCRTAGVHCPLGTVCNHDGKCQEFAPLVDVCKDEFVLNKAFYNALQYVKAKDAKKLAGPLAVYMVIHMIFLIWGILLAFASQPKANRVIHITLAIVFGPAYVLAYYLNMF